MEHVHDCGFNNFAEEIMCVTYGYNHPTQKKPGMKIDYRYRICREASCSIVWIASIYMEN